MPRLRAGRLSPQFRDVITHDVEKEGEVIFRGEGEGCVSPAGESKEEITLKSSLLRECVMWDYIPLRISHTQCIAC